MIESFHIQNYRLFKELHLTGLRRVNLFAGKNNTGKTALLEALRIAAAQGESSVVNHILAGRGAFRRGDAQCYSTLFNRNAIKQGGLHKFIDMRLGDLTMRRERIEDSKNELYAYNFIDKGRGLNIHEFPERPRDACVFLGFTDAINFPVQEFWDKIVLTPLEDDVVTILKKTLLPNIVRIDVRQDRTLVRLASEDAPVPLKELGDGAQRMLQLAIALVSAKNRWLLVDEIEAGLHFSVQERLWELVFHYAQLWNIQVFATTHSQDVIKAFTYLLEQPAYQTEGAYFRLQHARQTEDIEVIGYDAERLEFMLEHNVEPR